MILTAELVLFTCWPPGPLALYVSIRRSLSSIWTVISVSTRSQQDLSPMHAKGLTLHVVFMLIPMLHNIGRERHGAILRKLAALVDANKLKPLIDEQKFNIADIDLAHKHLESGAAIGKVIVTM